MSKFLKLLLCFTLLFTLCGCDENEPTVNHTHTVKYYDNNGKLLKNVEVPEGTFTPEEIAPAVEGYEFAGWAYNDEIIYDMYVETDIELFAQYDEINAIIYIEQPEQYVAVNEKGKIEWFTDPESYKEKVTVYCADDKVLTVDEEGNCYGISEGIATVTISNNYSSAFIIVHVYDDRPKTDTFKLTSDEFVNLSMNQTHQIQITSNYSNGEAKPVYYGSEDSNVAVVDEKGLVKAVGYGQTIIHCFTADGNYNTLVFIYVNGGTLNAHLADSTRVYGINDTVEFFLEYSIYKNNSCTTINGLKEKNVKMVIDDGPEVVAFENNALKVTGSYGGVITVHFELGDYVSNQMLIQIR